MKSKIVIIIIVSIVIITLILLGFNILNTNNKTFVELEEAFTLKKNEKVYINLDNKKIEIKLDKIIDNRCIGKDILCTWEGEFIVKIKINNANYELGSVMKATYNIKGTKYNINYIPEYSENKATFIIKEQ